MDYSESAVMPYSVQAGLCPPLPQHQFQRPPCYPSLDQLQFRPLQPRDFGPLKLLHQQLFPVDYDDLFFHRATHGLEDIASLAAVAPLQALPSLRHCAGAPVGASGHGSASGLPHPGTLHFHQHQQLPQEAWAAEQLVGFVTAKPCALAEVDPRDRALLGYADPACDAGSLLYILTLGVAESHRGCGIATRLVEAVVRQAAEASCRATYLHVISYNAPAIAFYRRLGFRDVALLPDFYVIRSGRQINPHRQVYDAVLFALPLEPELPNASLTIPMTTALAAPPGGPAGSGVMRAVSQLAACVPLPARCSPARRRSDSPGPPAGGIHDSEHDSTEGSSNWAPSGSSSSTVLGPARWLEGKEGQLLHRRAGVGGAGSGEPLAAAGSSGRHQSSRPPEWLRGLFARRQN